MRRSQRQCRRAAHRSPASALVPAERDAAIRRTAAAVCRGAGRGRADRRPQRAGERVPARRVAHGARGRCAAAGGGGDAAAADPAAHSRHPRRASARARARLGAGPAVSHRSERLCARGDQSAGGCASSARQIAVESPDAIFARHSLGSSHTLCVVGNKQRRRRRNLCSAAAARHANALTVLLYRTSHTHAQTVHIPQLRRHLSRMNAALRAHSPAPAHAPQCASASASAFSTGRGRGRRCGRCRFGHR